MEVKEELNEIDFKAKSPEDRDLALFRKLEEVSKQVACLCSSPWRLAVPAIKWGSAAAVIITLIATGYVKEALALLKVFGGM